MWHPPGKAPTVPSWLHSCRDGTIRTSKGKKIRLEGLQYFGAGQGAVGAGACNGQYHFPPTFAGSDLRKWGFNEVELFISWQNVEPNPPTKKSGRLVHHYDWAYLRALDHAIGRFRKAGVAVVLAEMQSRWSAAFQHIVAGNMSYSCGRGMPAWIYERDNRSAGGALQMVHAEVNFFQNRTRVKAGGVSEPIQRSFRRMWRLVAHRYRRNRTVVGIIPMWEPYDILTRNYAGAGSVTPRMLHLARFYERTGAAIHRVNGRVLLIFPEQLSRTTHRWALTRRPKVRNGVMGSEFYAGRWATDGVQRMRVHVVRAHHWHYPFYVDEFDAFGETTNRPHPGWKTSTSGMLAYCRKHHVSWALLAYGQGGFQQANDVRQPKSADLLRILRSGF